MLPSNLADVELFQVLMGLLLRSKLFLKVLSMVGMRTGVITLFVMVAARGGMPPLVIDQVTTIASARGEEGWRGVRGPIRTSSIPCPWDKC